MLVAVIDSSSDTEAAGEFSYRWTRWSCMPGDPDLVGGKPRRRRRVLQRALANAEGLCFVRRTGGPRECCFPCRARRLACADGGYLSKPTAAPSLARDTVPAPAGKPR